MRRWLCWSFLPALVSPGLAQEAALRFAGIFGDHMVLQQSAEVPVWGFAAPGSEVEVAGSWGGEPVRARTDAAGRWQVPLTTTAASGPHRVTVRCGEQRLQLEDVLLGEVWLGSGQSNMAWSIRRLGGWQPEPQGQGAADQAELPQVRLCTVEQQTSATPAADLAARWVVCSPDAAMDFSGVALFFGRELHRTLEVPIGLVVSAWGGTVCEAWTSGPALGPFPEFQPALAKLAAEAKGPPAEPPVQPAGAAAAKKRGAEPNRPSVLWNGMVAPLRPFRFAGVLWYQGESNRGRADQYSRLFPAMITDWRAAFGRELPFFFVQIAPFGYRDKGTETGDLRAAQAAALALPGTGMVVTMDVGDPGNIHPRDKRTVGERLARQALAKVHGRKLVCDGPRAPSCRLADGTVEVRFLEGTEGGLRAGGGPVPGFELAGQDGVFRPAEGWLEDDGSIAVRTADVPSPRQIRYAWGEAAMTTLANGHGLPAWPFRQQL